LPLFKSFRAPKANISMSVSKDQLSLGEAIEGTATITSQEAFEADEIRIELIAYETLRPGGGIITDRQESIETRMYSPPRQNAQTSASVTYAMHRGKTAIAKNLTVSNGFLQQFSFRIPVPSNLGPTFQGRRKDGRWLQRRWVLKAVLAVGGRPDVDIQRDICVSIPPPLTSTVVATTVSTVAAASNNQISHTAEIPVVTIQQPEPPKEMITCCPKCGASINPSQEDLIVTCRYCGFTVSLASRDEIKAHSMLENHLYAQQAVEAAHKYMDKGIFRSGVARDAQITNVKLRFIPFWVFPVTTYTAYSGVTGAGLTGEMNQVESALADKRASKLSKFGRLMKAGASAYFESQQRNQGPRTVNLSFSSHYVWPIIARKSEIAEINYYDVPAARKIPFDVGRIPSDSEFLNTEYKQEEAKLKVKAEVDAKERQTACGKVDNLHSCTTTVTVSDGELVHAPIWFVHYALNGENYMILVDGSEGKILGGGKPLFHI
jgi:DNA-directed RNA polymerase subunit RPC12/RpoP